MNVGTLASLDFVHFLLVSLSTKVKDAKSFRVGRGDLTLERVCLLSCKGLLLASQIHHEVNPAFYLSK